ncbi:conjugal transfer protein TraI [Pseudoflavitalea sp. X16]|uniref:conjugal transfer protein TraI n=1 Tax=Paraflavitalea devenefica TaxID=2716334 RepID=UPI0014201D62|nr:conjugal transfer protein TraI [Paraflavitalea devenefica]NII26157.1 conjugal transfer protein TraI [Paraflavitalea devenefica]
MKRIFFTLGLTMTLCLVSIRPAQAEPITVIITTAVKKILKAMDLAVQRLQNVTIKLQNAQKALENVMSKLKLDEIFEWTEKQRKLFAGYYEELWKVKNAIATYKRTRAIVDNQLAVLAEYRRAVRLFSGDPHFTQEKLDDIMEVYLGILNESLKNVEQISIVINGFTTQMSDAKRMEIINATDDRVKRNLIDIRKFTNDQVIARVQKARDEQELATLQQYYGITE